MIVVIAEKPSLGRAVAEALPDRFTKREGYLQGTYIVVTWAFGHLYELKDIEDYEPSYKGKPWDQIPLPYCPNPFAFQVKHDHKTKKVDSGVAKQVKVISNLINDPDTTEIVCCGDADREGEVIVRLILLYCLKNKNKKITRLWLPEQTAKGIYNGFENRKSDSEYNNLYNEGLARTFVDWLLGINLSRSLSVRTQTGLSVGRVVCPIVLAIYERDQAIKNFKPEKYIQLEAKKAIPLTSKYKFDPNQLSECIQRRNAYNSTKAKVLKIEQKQETTKAPRLFSLSKLQGECGKKYKMSPKETLSVVQSLYEKGFVTYPRTNTEFLAENEKDKVKELLNVHGNGYCEFKDTKTIFDDSKIESHSALTPTYKIASDLSTKENQVYQLILHRFLANFWKEPYTKNVTKADIQVGSGSLSEVITIKGSTVVTKGWTTIEEAKTKDTVLPPLKEGQEIPVLFETVEKMTQPPKKYTASSLNEYLKHPFKKDDDSIEEEYRQLFLGCEIGTEATRADIIDKAIQKQYISLSKNVYSIENKGVFLVEVMKKLNLDMSVSKTVELQKTLKSVYHNEITVNDAVQNAMDFLNDYFNNTKNQETEKFDSQKENIMGNCPWCGQPLYKRKGKYGIFYSHGSDSQCTFILNHKIKIYGQDVSLTEKQVIRLLHGYAIPVSLISKEGRPYKVKVSLKSESRSYNGKLYPDFTIEFMKSMKSSS